MTGPTVAALLVAAVVVGDGAGLRSARRATGRRVAAIGPRRHEVATVEDATGEDANTGAAVGTRMRGLGAAGAALAVVTLLGSSGRFVAVAAAAAAAGIAWTVLGRLEPAARRRARASVVAELPGAVDLVAAALAAGATVDGALRTAGHAAGGAVGDAFVRASALLALGGTPRAVFAEWHADPVLAPLDPFGRVLVRALTSGTALVAVTARFAEDLRAAQRHESEAIARKVAVRAAVPLGVCFLPAFVLLAVVPAVLAGARTLGL